MKSGTRHDVRVVHLKHCTVTTKLDNLIGITPAEAALVLAGDRVTLADGRIVELVRKTEQP